MNKLIDIIISLLDTNALCRSAFARAAHYEGQVAMSNLAANFNAIGDAVLGDICNLMELSPPEGVISDCNGRADNWSL